MKFIVCILLGSVLLAACGSLAHAPTPTLPPDSDAQNGEVLFNTYQPGAGFQCATCHSATSEARLVGPGLWNVAKRAAARDQNPIEYLYTSIANPGSFVVEGYPDHLMPQTWDEIYTEQQIYDLVAYLLSLQDT